VRLPVSGKLREISAERGLAVLVDLADRDSKGSADEIVEFIKPGTDLEGEIHRVLRADVEKAKYRPSDVVAYARDQGFPRFKQHHHTELVKALKARDKKKPYGTFVDIQDKDWRWYKPWLEEVLKHCRKNGEQFGPSGLNPGEPVVPSAS
jgi:hypothetical protein